MPRGQEVIRSTAVNPQMLDLNGSRVLERIRTKEFSEKAIAWASQLSGLKGVPPNKELNVRTEDLPEFHLVLHGNGAVTEYTPDPDSAGMGLVLLPEIDLGTDPDENGKAKSVRLDADIDKESGEHRPILWQMGPDMIRAALASRAMEFMTMHSDETHAYVRKLLSGEIPHIPRSNTPSLVLEELLKAEVEIEDGVRRIKARKVIATKELAYKRQSHDGRLSRKTSARTGTLLLGPDGVVSSVFALGGMPPVTGSKDVLVTAAMSYMRSWIPRNGVFAGNFERQLRLFKEAKVQIESLELPSDIEKNTIAQIGIAVGCENPQQVADQVKRYKEAGGHAARIYTTNPDSRIVETAEAIRMAVGEDFLICVGPVTDLQQAIKLKDRANVQMFLAGHGGGENCTSLTAGGAANGIEIAYQMYLDPKFNDCIIGLEGGTGSSIGALLPMLDVISLNKRGVGGIESTGGLYAQRTRDGKVERVVPYHGSASAVTRLIEAYVSPELAHKILGSNGMVLNVEGVPNYAAVPKHIRSIADLIAEHREHVGLALADQRAESLYTLRGLVAKEKRHNHVSASESSVVVANSHRP